MVALPSRRLTPAERALFELVIAELQVVAAEQFKGFLMSIVEEEKRHDRFVRSRAAWPRGPS